MIKMQICRSLVLGFCLAALLAGSTESEAKTTRRPVKKATSRKKVSRKAAPKKSVTKKAAPRKAVSASAPQATIITDYQAQSRQRAIEWVKQAAITFEQGDYQRTIELCKAANDAYPTYARAYTWMGASYQKLGKTDEACSAFRWVIALAPNTPDAERAERGLREMGYYNRW
jgi:Flp pilus assembly protein TadD